MHEAKRLSIQNALQRYRETVEQHNFRILRIIVEGTEVRPTPAAISEERANKSRVAAFHQWLGKNVTDFASSPRDLLSDDVRPKIVSQYDLDGVDHYPNDLEKRERWFATIRAEITKRNITADHFPPTELQYLCTLVSGICGPGPQHWRKYQQLPLLELLWENETRALTKTRVTVPIRDDEESVNQLTFVWEDWDIAVGVKIGDGPRGGANSYALFCRNESHDLWKWRYGLIEQDWGSDIFDSVEDYLDYYAHYEEPTEEDARKCIRAMNAEPWH